MKDEDRDTVDSPSDHDLALSRRRMLLGMAAGAVAVAVGGAALSAPLPRAPPRQLCTHTIATSTGRQNQPRHCPRSSAIPVKRRPSARQPLQRRPAARRKISPLPRTRSHAAQLPHQRRPATQGRRLWRMGIRTNLDTDIRGSRPHPHGHYLTACALECTPPPATIASNSGCDYIVAMILMYVSAAGKTAAWSAPSPITPPNSTTPSPAEKSSASPGTPPTKSAQPAYTRCIPLL